ncbi:MAG TPA: hypothetical protein VEK57_22410 [Thermoanaerobaculia bacterium]|nr:hypothetical protein [Thermoanaerobaculia bacterium]
MSKSEDEETRLAVPSESGMPAEAERPASPRRPPEELVPKVLEAMDVLTEYLGLQAPQPATAKRVRGARTVSREFVLSLAASVESEPRMPKFAPFDSQRAREVLQAKDALRIVGERMKIFQTCLSYTIEAEWAEVVASAMHTYRLAGALAEFPENAALGPHLEILRQHLGRKNGSTKKKAGTKRKRKGEEQDEE